MILNDFTMASPVLACYMLSVGSTRGIPRASKRGILV